MEAVGISVIASQGLYLVDLYKSYKIDDRHLSVIKDMQNLDLIKLYLRKVKKIQNGSQKREKKVLYLIQKHLLMK